MNLPLPHGSEMYDLEEIVVIRKGLTPQPTREEPRIQIFTIELRKTRHQGPRRYPTSPPNFLGCKVYRIVVSSAKNTLFSNAIVPTSATPCQPGRTRRNCHLPGRCFGDQLPPTQDRVNPQLTVPFRCPESGLAQTGTNSNDLIDLTFRR